MIRREKARALPGTMTSAVDERLIRRSITAWRQCAQTYYEEVANTVKGILRSLCDKHFGEYRHTGLYAEAWYPPAELRG